MTTNTWKAMGIALLTIAPATAGARPHDAYTQFIPGCQQATIAMQREADPHVEYYDALVTNVCGPTAVAQGVAELWVDGRLVEQAPLDSEGRARLQHLKGGLSRQAPCVVIRGEQFQPCDHKITDTPGHVRHGATFPLQVEECAAMPAAQ
jgi:hypothetical protein